MIFTRRRNRVMIRSSQILPPRYRFYVFNYIGIGFLTVLLLITIPLWIPFYWVGKHVVDVVDKLEEKEKRKP